MGMRDGSLQNDYAVCDPVEHRRLHVGHVGACPGSLDRQLHPGCIGALFYCVERVMERSPPG